MRKSIRRITTLALAIAITSSSPVFAAGFQISEVSATGVGRAMAGLGVSGDSISEMFANPASLALGSGTEVEFGLHAISPSAEFTNQGSTQTLATPTGPVTFPSSGPNSDGGSSAIIPNIFIAGPTNSEIRYGIGITSPFGLATEYDANWVGRYAGIKSELETVDLNPMMAFTVGPVSVGIGFSVMSVDSELTRALYTGPGSPDGLVSLKGDDTATAWNAGFITDDDTGRFGIGFRSHIDVDIDGTLNVSPTGATAGFTSRVRYPATYYMSGLIKASKKLDLLGSLRWTEWSDFNELRFKFDNGMPDSVIPENWGGSSMASVGFTYRKSDAWTYRGGIAIDKTPTDDANRTARIPDAERFWISFGGSYAASKNVRVDFGYAHIMGDNVNLSESTNLVASAPGAATDNLRGQYTDTDADILSIAVSYKFGNQEQ